MAASCEAIGARPESDLIRVNPTKLFVGAEVTRLKLQRNQRLDTIFVSVAASWQSAALSDPQEWRRSPQMPLRPMATLFCEVNRRDVNGGVGQASRLSPNQ
jgi:hypothetical protein